MGLAQALLLQLHRLSAVLSFTLHCLLTLHRLRQHTGHRQSCLFRHVLPLPRRLSHLHCHLCLRDYVHLRGHDLPDCHPLKFLFYIHLVFLDFVLLIRFPASSRVNLNLPKSDLLVV